MYRPTVAGEIPMCTTWELPSFFYFSSVKDFTTSSYLQTILALVRLLSTVSSFVPFHVILLNKPHTTFIATKWLLT